MSDDNWWESEADDYQSTTNRVWKAESGEHDIKASDLPPPPPPPPARPPPLPPGWSHLAASESSLSPPTGSAPISSPLSPTARPSPTPLHAYPSALSTATTDHSDDEEDDDFSSHASGATKSSAVPDAWVEVRDVANDRVYWINPATQRISNTNPNAADGGAPTVPATETMDASELTGLDDSIDIRRNSMILGSAWDEGAYESKAHAHAVDVGNTFTGNLRTARKNTMSSQMLKLLNGVSTKVELFVDMATEMPSAVAEHLQVIRERIAAIQELLENEGNNVDSRDDVTALVEFDKLKWDFNSDEVAAFRARAVRVPHDKYEYKNWHMPQFFTNKPMPAILIQPREKEKEWSILCTVKLPVSPEETMQSTRISLTVDDTAESAIHKAFAKYKGTTSLGPESGYVLKAIGFRDFMEGNRRLLSYEYIRDCLHDGQQHLELVLAPKPAPLPPPPAEEKDKLPSAYKAKVDPETKVLTIFDYTNVTTKCDWEDMKSIPISELNLPFRVKINGVEGVSQEALPRYDQTMSQLLVKAVLFHGEETLQIYQSRAQPSSANPRWMEWLTKGVSTPGVLTRDLMYPQIPRASRVVFLVYGQVYEKLELLGWVAVQLVDQYGRLRSGPMSLKLWKMDTNRKEAEQKLDFLFRSTTRDNQSDEVTALLTVEFDEFLLPVVAPLVEVYHEPNPAIVGLEIPESKWDAKVKKQLKLLIEQDVLYSITPPDRTLIWSARHALTKMPYALPKLLQSVDWTSQEHRMEVYRLLKQWTPFPNPAHALELLDSKYADYTVREYAVNCLRSLADDDLAIYLLQLVQCLKFEPYHDSPLARFLIERSILNPYQIGHYFFWHVKAEISVPDFCERFAVVLEEYLSHAGDFAKELRKQATIVQKLQRVAEFIAKGKNEDKISDTELMKKYRAELEKLNRDFQKMGSFPVPLNPKLQATTLIVEKCRYMSSKKVPLWLVFNNADKDAAPIYVIFKSGDDLRQDILTLQLLRIMDSIWLNEGLDMRLKPYRCLATGVNDEGEGVGMIEVVLNSDTTSGIQLKYGGGAMGALRMEPLDNFLRDHNKSPDAYGKAVENFIHSCAGYCVATFVMGIGDRHNGNIMVTKDGHLFHIDFGHFLGNFKKKFGINRERAAFVFTPEMAYVMGGAKYKKSQLFKDFKDLSCKAFNVLRKHGAFLETLFMLMVAAGMPELMKVDDVTYLREKLLLGMNEKEAEKAFKDEIKKSLDTTWRRIDNAIHNLKHG